MVYVRVPASSANMGSGFDSLGIALGIYNTLKISEIESAVSAAKIGHTEAKSIIVQR